MGRRTGSRRWEWHRVSARWADRIVHHAGVRPGELVLDVGAGDGALTRPLVRAGARVIAVERHPGRAAELARRFPGPEVKVVRAVLLAWAAATAVGAALVSLPVADELRAVGAPTAACVAAAGVLAVTARTLRSS